MALAKAVRGLVLLTHCHLLITRIQHFFPVLVNFIVSLFRKLARTGTMNKKDKEEKKKMEKMEHSDSIDEKNELAMEEVGGGRCCVTKG